MLLDVSGGFRNVVGLVFGLVCLYCIILVIVDIGRYVVLVYGVDVIFGWW